MQGQWLKRYKLNWKEMHNQVRKIIIVCQTDSKGHHKTGNKNHQRHDPQKINLMQAQWTTHLKQNWNRIHANSAKTLSLLAREIPIYITKLEPKITTDDSIYGWAILCWDIDSNDVIWCATKCTDIQLQNVTTVCQGDSYGRQKKWKQKSSERHDPQQINLMQGHWLKRYQLKWNEMHRQSAAKNHHCLSNRFLRTPQNWKQKSSETRSTKNSIWCSHIEPRNLNRKKTEFTHSQLKHYHWFSERLLCKPQNWKQKSSVTRSTKNQFDTATLNHAL